jgi:hypothetical protein
VKRKCFASGRGIRKLAYSEEARVGEFEQGVEIEASTIESRKVAGCSSRDTVKDGLVIGRRTFFFVGRRLTAP